MKKILENKIFKIIINIIKYIFITITSLFVILTVYQRVMPNNKILGFRTYVIISESMKPMYEIGDIILSKEVEPSKLKINDVIVYYSNSGEYQGKVITHQIKEIYKDIDKYTFKTKGLANMIDDKELVKEEEIYGRVIYKFKIISLISKLVRNKYGALICIIIPMFWILIIEFKELKDKIINKN